MAIAPLVHDTPPKKHPQHFAPELGDRLINYLERLGVEYVFGVPGGAIEPLYNALARSARRGGPRPVVARHESGAAFMAQGYAAATGKLGVCCATTGPGATNTLTGVASAYQEEVPLLVITAQTPLSTFGKGGFQESSCDGVDTLGLFAHCTRYNSLVSHGAQLEHKLVAALMAAFGDTPGPVHLTFPVDVLRSPAPVGGQPCDIRSLLVKPSLVDEPLVKRLWDKLAGKKLAILIGDGCSEAADHIVAFAERTGARLVTTPAAKGLVEPYHPLYRGVFGFAGHPCARQSLVDPSVDSVLVVGSSLSEWDTAGWDIDPELYSRLIHIDASDAHLARSPMACLHVRGRIKAVFERLLGYLQTHGSRSPDFHDGIATEVSASPDRALQPLFLGETGTEYTERAQGVKPQWLMDKLGRCFPPGTRFLADVGNSTAWAIHYLNPANPGRVNWFGATTRYAAMGWAIGMAVGVAMADRERPVVCITGDGSMLMNGQELTVAVAENLPVVFVVLNDGALGMVKHGQRMAKAEPVAFQLPPVDFAAIAKAQGARGIRIGSSKELDALDTHALCGSSGPVLIDVHVDPDAVPPMGTRIKVLGENRGA